MYHAKSYLHSTAVGRIRRSYSVIDRQKVSVTRLSRSVSVVREGRVSVTALSWAHNCNFSIIASNPGVKISA